MTDFERIIWTWGWAKAKRRRICKRKTSTPSGSCDYPCPAESPCPSFCRGSHENSPCHHSKAKLKLAKLPGSHEKLDLPYQLTIYCDISLLFPYQCTAENSGDRQWKFKKFWKKNTVRSAPILSFKPSVSCSFSSSTGEFGWNECDWSVRGWEIWRLIYISCFWVI